MIDTYFFYIGGYWILIANNYDDNNSGRWEWVGLRGCGQVKMETIVFEQQLKNKINKRIKIMTITMRGTVVSPLVWFVPEAFGERELP